MEKKPPKKRAVLTPEQERAAKRLREEWDRKKKLLNLKQKPFAIEFNLGKTQGIVGQYLNGVIPLNYQALIKFCRGLSVDPMEIYPELVERVQGEAVDDRRSKISPDAEEVAHLYQQLGPQARDHIRAFLRMAVTLVRNGMQVNLEPDERYVEYEKNIEIKQVERRKEKT